MLSFTFCGLSEKDISFEFKFGRALRGDKSLLFLQAEKIHGVFTLRGIGVLSSYGMFLVQHFWVGVLGESIVSFPDGVISPREFSKIGGI